MHRKKLYTLSVCIFTLSIFLLCACGAPDVGTPTTIPSGTTAPTASVSGDAGSEAVVTPADSTSDSGTGSTTVVVTPNGSEDAEDAEFTKFDRNASWDSSDSVITLNGSSADFPADSCSLTSSVLSVTKEGTYVLSGAFDGQIFVNVADEEKVQLVLNGADISCSFGPAVYVQNADKVSITLADGTVNTLTDGTSYTETGDKAPNACVFSRDDLSVNGNGTLTVNANFNNGIDTSNDLRIVSGTITVKAANHALKGNDSVAVMGGTITLNAASDGIKSDTEDEAGKGYFYMSGGTLDITASDDGIQTTSSIQVTGGAISFHVVDDRLNCDGTVSVADGVVK